MGYVPHNSEKAFEHCGHYAKDFKAFDKHGDTLIVTRTDENLWTITNSDRIATISMK
jgi:hypothetical protein